MTATTLKELAHRSHDGLEVTLLWNPDSNEVSIDVVDERLETRFSRTVSPGSALDAFHHPYVYAPAWIEVVSTAAIESAAIDG
jgi:hypothetical protein